MKGSRLISNLGKARLWIHLLLAGLTIPAWAQIGSNPKQEFRAAWIATVTNLDWPTQGAPAAQQQAELVRLLDRLKAAGINAVLFQVRNEADALYASPYEPWSVFLTGTQGQDPGYDPLAFAIEEAHKRGMELHAWFNPYRVWVSSRNYPRHPSSVYLTKPEWLLTINNAVTILNPGIPAVRSYLVQIIRDVVERYDVDGIHFDDYFYPYPPNAITTQDQATYNEFGTAFGSLPTFRAYSVNMLVKGVRDMLAGVRPDVKWGISPFGIWKSGTPAGITGMSGATEIYADAVIWMQQSWLDYLTPQLYWAFGGGQDYGKLAPWWATQMNGRHLYPGLGAYRSDPITYSGTLFSASEIPNQVRLNRRTANAFGQVFFRASNLNPAMSKGLADTLATGLFRHAALTPTMTWKDLSAPAPPANVTVSWTGNSGYTLNWAPPPGGSPTRIRFYAVYRVRSSSVPDWQAAMADPANLFAVTGQTSVSDVPPTTAEPYRYVVTAISPNSVESIPTPEIVIQGSTGIETDMPLAFGLEPAWPNPFRRDTHIRFALGTPSQVDISVYDALGRRVDVLTGTETLEAGEHIVRWAPDPGAVGTGTYFVVLRAGQHTLTRAVVRTN